jgi:cephalosporin hydroxylase
MDELKRFSDEVNANVDRLMADGDVQARARAWLSELTRQRCVYNFTWLGRTIIQVPRDVLAVQEIIWQVRPDLIVETGIAHGGSLIHSASLLELLGGDGTVVGVDVDIRSHNRREIEAHPLAKRTRLIEGSSTEASVASKGEHHARQGQQPQDRGMAVPQDDPPFRDRYPHSGHAAADMRTRGVSAVRR